MFSLRIPLLLLQFIGVFIVVLTLIACVGFNAYQKSRDDHIIADKLWDENHLLAEQLDLLTLATEDLLRQVEQVELLGEEVREIVDLPPPDERSGSSLPPVVGAVGGAARVLPGRSGNPVIERTVLNVALLQEVLVKRSEDLSHLKEVALAYRRELAATPSLWPVEGKVSSEFGPRRSPFTGRKEFHEGLDLAAPLGTPVRAAADGTVELARHLRRIGNVIILNHGYGYQTMYGHLSSFAVGSGDLIDKGQIIGYVGNTGASTGPHLHYAVFVNDVAVNPRDYLSKER